jgi:hypothetical protein
MRLQSTLNAAGIIFESAVDTENSTLPRIEILDGFNSNGIDFEPVEIEHFRVCAL